MKEDFICMKKPEMEIVKFHNEDVIATSNWSGRLSLVVWPTTGNNGTDTLDFTAYGSTVDNTIIWANNSGFNAYNNTGNSTNGNKYSNVNIVDNHAIDDFTPDLFTFYHYDNGSLIGGWKKTNGNYENKVYNVWKTCYGGDSCDGSCHPAN